VVLVYKRWNLVKQEAISYWGLKCMWAELVWGSLWNSRNPDTRHLWKWGSEQHFMTPLPRDRLDRLDWLDLYVNSKKLMFSRIYDDFGTFHCTRYPIFNKSRRRPKAAQVGPKGPQKTANGIQGPPKGSQREPKVVANGQHGARHKKHTRIYTMTIHAKGIISIIHQLETMEDNFEHVFGNVLPPRWDVPPNTQNLPTVHTVSLVPLLESNIQEIASTGNECIIEEKH